MPNDIKDGIAHVIADWMVEHELEPTEVGITMLHDLRDRLTKWVEDYVED